jgi:hypothetical protein
VHKKLFPLRHANLESESWYGVSDDSLPARSKNMIRRYGGIEGKKLKIEN